MAVTTQARRGVAAAQLGRSRLLRKLPLHLTVSVVMAIWLVPTLGLIVNSFRTVPDMNASGWWTALSLSRSALSVSNC